MHPPSSTSNDITLILLYLVTTWLLGNLESLWWLQGSLDETKWVLIYFVLAISLSLALTAHPFLHTGEGMSRSHIAFSIYPSNSSGRMWMLGFLVGG